MGRLQNNPSIGWMICAPIIYTCASIISMGQYLNAQIEITKNFIDAKKYIITTCFENKKPSHLPLLQTFHQTSHLGHGECIPLARIAISES